ncbi:hypothetical protein TNIN_250361 [Trichonephila inaurata madagascariensis]|uniref:Uncharacterized protein n=1 Tax=Trichonephila inaurata madagascariensis TaxID=2747483 RepID=A0A8X6XJ29_9ARAC|nr:hypothetical protein TNIN_250361 [Trichonephila inaurata madagascariensis]
MLTDLAFPSFYPFTGVAEFFFFPLPIYPLGARTVVPERSDDTLFCVIRSTWRTVASLKRTWSYVIGLEFGHPKAIGELKEGICTNKESVVFPKAFSLKGTLVSFTIFFPRK